MEITQEEFDTAKKTIEEIVYEPKDARVPATNKDS